MNSLSKTLLFFALFGGTALAKDLSVPPGGNIQAAIDQASKTGGGVVTLEKGTHLIEAPLKIASHITLQGEGKLETTIKTEEDISMIIPASRDLKNTTIQNLIIIGVPKKKSWGIHLTAPGTTIENLTLSQVHVFETGWGVHIKGAKNVTIEDCNFSRNGNQESLKYAHNLYLRRCHEVRVSHSIFNNSTSANGINISYSSNIEITACEASGNHFRGMRAADSDGFKVTHCTISKNGNVGLLANSEKSVTKNIHWTDNHVFNNQAEGIYARPGATGTCKNNNSYGN